jgi:hypothetical protein
MLLRALEEKTFLPLGSDRGSHSDFQLIAGTNRDLFADVREGRPASTFGPSRCRGSGHVPRTSSPTFDSNSTSTLRRQAITSRSGHRNAAQGIRCWDRATLDWPQVPGDHDAPPGAGHRCSRRVGPGDYSVRREGRAGAAKVRRARNSFSSEGRTIACPRPRAGTRRVKARYLSIRSLCA